MRNILITGGTGKIGSLIIKELLNNGHKIVFTGRCNEKNKFLLNAFKEYEEQIFSVEVDLLSKNNFNWIKDLPIKIDCFISNARSLDNLKISDEGIVANGDFLDDFDLAIVSPYNIINQLIKFNFKIKDIIFISSIYGIVGPNPSLYTDFKTQSPINYGISKASQIHMVKELAIRLAPKVRVNCISFGGLKGRVDSKFIKRYSSLVPNNRMLNELDIFPTISHIIENPHLAITGENFKVDGGWTIW